MDSRVTMGQMLTERMQGTYSELRDTQTLGTKGALLKTWVVETSPRAGEDDAPRPSAILDEAFSSGALGEGASPRVEDVADDLSIISLRRDGEDVEFYADTANSRYWLLHSLARSTSVDWAMERAIHDSLTLDTLWLTPEMLNWISTLGFFKGLGLDFDRRPIVGEPEEEDEADSGSPLTYLKMQLWGNKARRVLDLLRDESAFPSETTLAKVKVKYFPDANLPEVFSVDDVKYNGKVTARGTSYEAHRGLLTRIVNAYSRTISRIEHDFTISYDVWRPERSSPSAGFTVAGDALVIRLTQELLDLEGFLQKVFNSSEPFRLWGAPREVGPNRFKVESFDLHIGCPVRFEVHPWEIRMYLPRGACGNTVARFLTNIQHHFDAAATLMSSGGEKVGFQP